MCSRDFKDLDPLLADRCSQFIRLCNESAINVLITCTYRSSEEQEQLYAKGRSLPGAIVTYARGGQSLHNTTLSGIPASRAFDFVPLVNGKVDWDGSHPNWIKCGLIGESLGLQWGGRFPGKKKDMPHFQLPTKD